MYMTNSSIFRSILTLWSYGYARAFVHCDTSIGQPLFFGSEKMRTRRRKKEDRSKNKD